MTTSKEMGEKDGENSVMRYLRAVVLKDILRLVLKYMLQVQGQLLII